MLVEPDISQVEALTRQIFSTRPLRPANHYTRRQLSVLREDLAALQPFL